MKRFAFRQLQRSNQTNAVQVIIEGTIAPASPQDMADILKALNGNFLATLLAELVESREEVRVKDGMA